MPAFVCSPLTVTAQVTPVMPVAALAVGAWLAPSYPKVNFVQVTAIAFGVIVNSFVVFVNVKFPFAVLAVAV